MSEKENWASVETWQIRKPAVHSKRGMVASQHYAASQAGAAVLADGGNAIDAAVATSLMIGTVEPWMSGLGGGGFMLYYDAATDKTHSVEFGMRASLVSSPEDYPVIDGQDSDLFGWPSVVDNRNVQGPHSIATPGYLAGLSAALEKFGSRSFSELVNPALESARQGMVADWYATLKIAAAAPVLSQYSESAKSYLPGGFPPAGEWGGPMPRILLGRLSDTLEQLQKHGPEDFYQGALAQSICADLKNLGSPITLADFRGYTPSFDQADTHNYRDATVYTAPGLSAGPTLCDTLSRLENQWKPAQHPNADTFSAYASALRDAYELRFKTMGDIDDSATPACTTHLTAIDSRGNMVALTQTLLSVFGSKVMLPNSGILMNNGMMWFDPRPGHPNSVGPGKRPLSNMCPTLFATANGKRYALGASGGRRIMPAVMQLISSVVDFDMTVEDAMYQGRIDVSGAPVVCVNERLGAEIKTRLANEHSTMNVPDGVYPALFACPNMLCGSKDGSNSGAAFITSPWAAVVPETDIT